MDVSQAGEQDIPALHQALVDKQVEAENITSARVEAAFGAVPRHLFLSGVPLEEVYRDQAITTKYLNGTPISSSSQPAIMAIMLEQLQLERGQRVLEIGAGTGYNAALMAHIVGTEGKVVTIDIDDDTVARAIQTQLPMTVSSLPSLPRISFQPGVSNSSATDASCYLYPFAVHR